MKRFSLHVLTVMLAVMGIVVVSGGCRQANEKPKGPAEKVTIAYTTVPHSVLFQIAFVKGFFSAEGLDVTPQPHAFGKLALNAVLEGKADFATVADTPIMFAAVGGKEISTIAVIMNSRKSVAIVANKDRGITRPLDLKGKNIGVTLGTTSDFFMDSFLVSHGIGRQEVGIIDMKPDEMRDALNKGKVAAVSTWYPNLIHLRNDLGNKGSIFYGEALYSENYCVAASREFVRTHPEAVRKVLRALVRAELFVQQNAEESRRIVAEFIKTDMALLDEIWNSFDFKVTLSQSLIISLEDQTRWAIKNRLTDNTNMPNYLDYVYPDGLAAVKPEAVRVIK